MTYATVVSRLGLQQVCLGCAITERSHRNGFIDGFGVVHWAERRVTKRGLRRLLLLVARRDRNRLNYDTEWLTRGFLNDRALYWAHFYFDEQRANEWAAKLGVRFPVEFSGPERRVVALVPGLSRSHPQIYQWARRGLQP
jgi:hypothetical protein